MHPGLAERSDRVARPLTAVVEACDGYDVVRQPDQPSYWFGNCLVLHDVPEPASLARWRSVWDRELGPDAGLGRVVVCAESPSPEVPAGLAEAAQAEGLELETDDVLVLGTLVPHPAPGDVQIRPVTDGEWDAVVDLVVGQYDAGQEGFERWRMGAYALLVASGRGRWWAAWRGGRPIASAGLFHGGGLGRYQQVLTSADHRRQGIAAALVAAMAAAHLARSPGDPLVIIAERDSSPARIYRRVGFTPAATAISLTGPVRAR